MNLILLFPDDFVSEGRVRLSGRRFRYVLKVHRASVGDVLRIGLIGDRVGTGRVTSLKDEILEMEVDLYQEPPSAPAVSLILALPRPKVLRRLLFSVAALGVKRIILLNAFRVEKSFWESPVLQDENIKKQLVLGLEQARDTILPGVALRTRFRPFVEDELPELVRGTCPVVGHPGAEALCPGSISGPATLAIGPEGGFIPYEVEKLVSCGFRSVNFGERILPVETAVPFILSRLC